MALTQRLWSPLPRTVVILGVVSFLNDCASEMITPLLPVFLTMALGAGPAIVGVIEGTAECAAGLLKLYSGWLADRGYTLRGLVLGGYAVSNTTRPLIALALGWPWVLTWRSLDRLGKGLRTSPRDAMIAGAVERSGRGRAFGFQRGMDHAGAVVGGLLAYCLLALGLTMEQVFMLSVVPGALVIAVLSRLPAGAWRAAAARRTDVGPHGWHGLDGPVRGLVIGAGGLALATVPEALLILWATRQGLELVHVPLLWVATHLVKSVVAYGAGRLSDRLGRLPIVVCGWGGRVAVLALIAALPEGAADPWSMMIAYGAALACTEGAERALIGDRALVGRKATAFGWYHLAASLMILPGGALCGFLWERFGVAAALLTAAVLTASSAAALISIALWPGRTAFARRASK